MLSRLGASGGAVPLRAPSLPNTPPRLTRTRTRVSLPGASAFILATPVVTQVPPPPGSLPEVAGPELGARLWVSLVVLGLSLWARGLGRGRATFSSAAQGETW